MKKYFIIYFLLAIIFIFLGCQREKPPNVPTLSGPDTGKTNIPVNITVQTTDPNKDDIAYLFNWGDGTRDSWTTYYASGQSISQSHIYLKPGNYDIVAKAKDIKGKESHWSNPHKISISSQVPYPPSTPTGPTNGIINTSYNFSTSAIDPDGDSIAYQFDWGDGSALIWTQYYPSGQVVSQSHIYTSPGTFNIKVKAKDKFGTESEWSPPLVIIIRVNQNPNTPSTPSGPTSGYINIPYIFSSSASDPDGDSIAIRFDWGDGVTSDWSRYLPSGSSISMSHSYSRPGTFYIKAQAKDIHNDTSAWSSSVTIDIEEEVIIMSENFEGAFPGSTWTLYGTPTWGKTSYRSYQGYYSGWCAGSSRNPSQGYASNMNAWMVYGPFSLADAYDAYVSFYRWANTEAGYDSLWAGASVDGIWFYRSYWCTGNFSQWEERILDLTDVPGLGNLCGRSQVWIAFRFVSDGSIQYEGAYLDSIVLIKYIGPKTSVKPRIVLQDSRETSGQIMPQKLKIPKD